MNWSNWPRVDLDCQSPCGFGILSTRRPWYLWVAWSFACCPASSSSTMSEVGFGQWHAVMWMTRAMPVMLHLLKIWKDWHEKLNFGKRRTGVEGWQCTNDQPRGKRWPTTLGESSWLLRRPQPPRRRNTPPCTATCTLPINITKEQDDRKSTTERTLRAPGGLFHCPFHLDHSHNSSCFTILLTLQLFTTLVATRRCRCLLWSDQVESLYFSACALWSRGSWLGGSLVSAWCCVASITCGALCVCQCSFFSVWCFSCCGHLLWVTGGLAKHEYLMLNSTYSAGHCNSVAGVRWVTTVRTSRCPLVQRRPAHAKPDFNWLFGPRNGTWKRTCGISCLRFLAPMRRLQCSTTQATFTNPSLLRATPLLRGMF